MSYSFSRRTDWPSGENELSLLLKSMLSRGEQVIDLTLANPTRAGLAYDQQKLLSALASAESLVYAPLPCGLLRTREAVGAYYAGKGIRVVPERLLLTAGTSEAYSFLFRLLTEPGDKVLVPAPGYPLFSFLADLNDVSLEHYRLRFEEGRWRIDFESLEGLLGPNARTVILVSPNNPTGSCVSRDELLQLNRLCAAHSAAIISDEVFCDYLFPGQEASFGSLAGNDEVLSFALGGISKSLALPQMKLAWIAANGPRDVLSEALARLEVIADTYLSVSTPVQHAAVKWLADMPAFSAMVLERVTGNYAFLCGELARSKAGECFPVQGGWYALLRREGLCVDENWALGLLAQERVSVHPGYFFDMPGEDFIVLSLLPESLDFQEGVRRLCRHMGGVHRG